MNTIRIHLKMLRIKKGMNHEELMLADFFDVPIDYLCVRTNNKDLLKSTKNLPIINLGFQNQPHTRPLHT